MSVALVIEWKKEGEPEILLSVAFQREWEQDWARIAEVQGPDHIGRWLPITIEAGNLQQILCELKQVRPEVLKLAHTEELKEYCNQKFDRLIEALTRMKSEEWVYASIG